MGLASTGRFVIKLVVYLSVLVVPSLASAQTPLSGPVSDGSGGPMTVAQGPYVVTGTAWVPSGATLTVEPGVTILHAELSHWIVEGTLEAEGTAEARSGSPGWRRRPGRGRGCT